VGGTHFWNSLHQVHSKIGHQIIKKKIGSKKTKGPKHDTLNCLRFTYPLGRSILCKHFIKLLLMGQTYCFHTVCSVLPSQEFVIPFTIYIELSQNFAGLLITVWRFTCHYGRLIGPFWKQLLPLFTWEYLIKKQLYNQLLIYFKWEFPHDIAEILLKVALNIIKQTNKQ
jgi:hypothetical protein